VNLVAIAVFFATFGAVVARQLARRGPPVWALLALGGFVTVATGVLSPSAATSVLSGSLGVLAFLFGLFVFARALERSGVLDHLGRWLIGRARTPRDLPLVVFVGLGVLSGWLLNDALVLIGVPLLFAVARRLESDPRPLLLTLAYSVTVGSVLTPLGNPQNLLVALESGLATPILVFLRYLLIPTAANLAIGGLYLRRVFGRALGRERAERATPWPPERPPRLVPPGPWARRLLEHPALVVFPATLVLLVGNDLAAELLRTPELSVDAIVLGGALIVLVLSHHRGELLARVDWSILVLFAALFVLVAGAVAGGVIEFAFGAVPLPLAPPQSAGLVGAIAASSVGGVQLVSNVPWVALQIPVLRAHGYAGAAPVAWMALAGASTLAGNATLLGAASNLIVVERAEKHGVRIGLVEFVRHGLPLTAITLAVLVVCLTFGI
jgi:Na+/H+ antiporter NhaD/arsenite permease-like protein